MTQEVSFNHFHGEKYELGKLQLYSQREILFQCDGVCGGSKVVVIRWGVWGGMRRVVVAGWW